LFGYNNSNSPKQFKGTASVFRRVGTAWTETTIASPGVTLPAGIHAPGDPFALSLALSGGRAAINVFGGYGLPPNSNIYQLTPK